ncbi:MAG: zinc ribbon domain-containing protein [bacterium]|nr:zinc ribbon domain-containing protein [bacterium]
MPTYEFRCKKCNKKFEVFTSISNKDKTVCPKCKGKALEQILGGFYLCGVKDISSGASKSSSSCSSCGSSNCSSCSSH